MCDKDSGGTNAMPASKPSILRRPTQTMQRIAPDMKNTDLFSPLQLGPLTLPNRIIMPPMTRMRARMPGNIPWELNAEYYRQRASAGLIVTEGTPVSPRGHGYYHTPGIYTEEQAAGWQLVTEAIHQAGGLVFIQLWHVGRITHRDLQPNGEAPVAPSAVAGVGQALTAPGIAKDYSTPRALTTGEITGVVEEFRQGAELAQKAGFDGVELHGANGYLIEQFLSDQTNQRTDQYGGTLANRTRFLMEVVEAVTSVWSADRVGVRLSPANTFGGSEFSDRFGTFSHVIGELNHYGLAYLHLVEPRVAGNKDLLHFDTTLSSRHFKPLITGNTRLFSAGGHHLDSAQAAIINHEADAVGFGRAFIANPDLPHRLATGAPLNRYQRETFYGGTEVGYTDYPALNPAEILT
jgi:N-ethylmaleimide reductase